MRFDSLQDEGETCIVQLGQPSANAEKHNPMHGWQSFFRDRSLS